MTGTSAAWGVASLRGSLEPGVRGASISAVAGLRVSRVLANMLADVVQQRGISAEVLFRDVPPADAESGQLCLAEYQRLFARAIALTGQPALGLLGVMTAREPCYGVMGALMGHARTLRDAFQLLTKFHGLLMEGVSIQVSEQAGRTCVRYALPRLGDAFDRRQAETMAAGLARLISVYGGRPEELLEVSFTHDKPAYHQVYAQLFGGAERFAQPVSRIVFASCVMDRVSLYAQPELHAVVRGQAERMLERLSRPTTFVERLDALLQTRPASESLEMGVAARELGVSRRTLHRRLEDEGVTYREVIEAARKRVACDMLSHPEHSVQSTSHALGFSSPAAFHRAFRRWTGSTPAHYRQRALRGQSVAD